MNKRIGSGRKRKHLSPGHVAPPPDPRLPRETGRKLKELQVCPSKTVSLKGCSEVDHPFLFRSLRIVRTLRHPAPGSAPYKCVRYESEDESQLPACPLSDRNRQASTGASNFQNRTCHSQCDLVTGANMRVMVT